MERVGGVRKGRTGLWRSALEELAQGGERPEGAGRSQVKLPGDDVGKAHAGLRDFMKKHGDEAAYAALREGWDADRLYVGRDEGVLWYVLEDG